jgi:hypothetical protein
MTDYNLPDKDDAPWLDTTYDEFMTNKTWKVMNDLEEAFNQVTTFSFLLDQLQEAVDTNDTQRIVDTTHALNAFYPPYIKNWDNKFLKAWEHVVKKDNAQ